MSGDIDQLKGLHTTVIDARNGYEEALKDADGKGLTTLFRDMITLHQKNADALSAMLYGHGQKADDSGSFLSSIHRTVMSIRALFGGLDASILSGLIDGEERILEYYDECLNKCSPSDIASLKQQRGALQAKVNEMKLKKNLVA